MDTLEEQHYFSSPVYVVQKPKFLESVRAVSTRYEDVSREHKKQPNYVNLMTASYAHEEELQEFSQYVSQTAWNILASQGYAMDQMVTFFSEMWTQEHNHSSSMETHIHGAGSQISAFYFIDTPDRACKLVVHDPRSAKVIIGLHEKDSTVITPGSNQIMFTPQPGTLIFINAWLPHSLTKNMSKDSMRFVHMNIAVAPQDSSVEVI